MRLKDELWEGLQADYKDCVRCQIGKDAHSHVLGKGHLSPKVVFIGEGPGKLEDLEGQPFVGLAGQLLATAIRDSKVEARHFFTNLVCCRPCDRVGGPNRQPSEIEITNCADRLKRTLFILAPSTVVLLGKVPQRALLEQPYLKKFKVYCIEHPAYILRQGGVGSAHYKNFTLKIKEALNASV